MMRQFIALVLVLAVSSAISDSFVQTIGKDGSSVIAKTTDLSIFADRLDPAALSAMDSFCKSSTKVDCSVDVKFKTITIRESFSPGSYFSRQADFGFPLISQTYTIDRLPTDTFSWALDTVLSSTGMKGGEGVPAISLLENNSARASSLRLLKINATYTVIIPNPVSDATSGSYAASVDGSTAVFDLSQVYDQSQPMVVVSRQVNYAVITGLVAAIVIIALAASFFFSKPAKSKKKGKK